MKNLRTVLLCVCLSLCSIPVLAQTKPVPLNEPDYSKPALFTSVPEHITVNADKLAGLLEAGVGSTIDITLGEMPFRGQVVSSSQNPKDQISSIVIRSSNFEGARLTFSRTIIDGALIYSGRIMSLQHGDLLELQNKNGQYIFVKKKLYDLMNE